MPKLSKKALERLRVVVRNIGAFKPPKELLKKPVKDPSKAELEKKWKFEM